MEKIKLKNGERKKMGAVTKTEAKNMGVGKEGAGVEGWRIDEFAKNKSKAPSVFILCKIPPKKVPKTAS